MTIRITARRKDGKVNVTYGFDNGVRLNKVLSVAQYEAEVADIKRRKAEELAQ